MATASSRSKARGHNHHHNHNEPQHKKCPCSTMAGLKTGMQGSTELYPSARWMVDPGRRAHHPIQGSNTVLAHGEFLTSVVRLIYEATTSSALCRRRSVWQNSLTDTSITSTAMSTPSDKLVGGQRYEVDVGQKGVLGEMQSRRRRVSRCCCRCLCLSRICDSGSSALFCEISYH